jgi:TPR repeat protein
MNIPELQRAAESGSVVAQSMLGLCYLYGHGVEVDYKEALRLLSIAMDKGASRAIVNLAHMYAEGLGVPKDLPKAIRFYEAVAKAEVRAQLELGRMYSRGVGVPANPEVALRWYSAAAARDDGVDDSATAAFVGALTFDEIKEAKAYVASATLRKKGRS